MSRKFFGTDGVRGLANTPPMTAEMALQARRRGGQVFPPRRRRQRPPGGDRQGHPAVGLHARKRADRRAHLDRHERAAARPGADAGGGAPDPFDARRSRDHDLGLAQPVPRQRHQVVRPRRVQAVGRGRGGDRGAARAARSSSARPANIGRAKRIDEGRHRYVEFIKTTFPVGQAARRAEGGGRLRQRRRLPAPRPKRCGSWAPRWCRSG